MSPSGRKPPPVLEAEEADEKAKDGNSLVKHGKAEETAETAKDGKSLSSNGNRHRTTKDCGNGPAINNTGNFTGHGNGAFVNGIFDASTRNYHKDAMVNHGKAEETTEKAKDRKSLSSNGNSGAYSGNGNNHRTTNNYGNGGPAINNSGKFTGHGNGVSMEGTFDASTRNYCF